MVLYVLVAVRFIHINKNKVNVLNHAKQVILVAYKYVKTHAIQNIICKHNKVISVLQNVQTSSYTMMQQS